MAIGSHNCTGSSSPAGESGKSTQAMLKALAGDEEVVCHSRHAQQLLVKRGRILRCLLPYGVDAQFVVLIPFPCLQPLRDLVVIHQVISRKPVRFSDEHNAQSSADSGLVGTPAEFAQSQPTVPVRLAEMPGYERKRSARLQLRFDRQACGLNVRGGDRRQPGSWELAHEPDDLSRPAVAGNFPRGHALPRRPPQPKWRRIPPGPETRKGGRARPGGGPVERRSSRRPARETDPVHRKPFRLL